MSMSAATAQEAYRVVQRTLTARRNPMARLLLVLLIATIAITSIWMVDGALNVWAAGPAPPANDCGCDLNSAGGKHVRL